MRCWGLPRLERVAHDGEGLRRARVVDKGGLRKHQRLHVDVEQLETVDAGLGLADKTSTLLLLLLVGRAGSCDLHVARHRLP